jgi:hypothetical protein
MVGAKRANVPREGLHLILRKNVATVDTITQSNIQIPPSLYRNR